MNIAVAPDIASRYLAYKRLYSCEDIQEDSTASVLFNKTPIYISCQNTGFDSFESDYYNTPPKPKQNKPYVPLFSVVTILMQIKHILAMNRNYKGQTVFNSMKETFKDRLFAQYTNIYNETITGVICLNISATEDQIHKLLGPEDYVGFRILFYMPFVKFKILDSSNANINSNEVILQGFQGIEFSDENYYLFGTHNFDNTILSSSLMGEFDLLKDLIMRIMTMFDKPLNTKCNKNTSYSIMTNEITENHGEDDEQDYFQNIVPF
jgi:hypothetical protein